MVWQNEEKEPPIRGRHLRKKPITLSGSGRSGWSCGNVNWDDDWTRLPRPQIRMLLALLLRRLRNEHALRVWIEEGERDETLDCGITSESEEDRPLSR